MRRWPIRAGGLILASGVLASCGGSGSGQSGVAYVLGGAEGVVTNRLGQKYNLQNSGGGQNLASASLIIIDGDHIAPTMLGSMNGLKAAVDAGVPLVAVDADTELKKSLADAINAPFATSGPSFATGYKKIVGDGDPYFKVWEIPSGKDKIQETSLKLVDGVLVGGPTTTTTIDKVVSQESIDRMVAGMSGVASRPSQAPRPPAGAPAFFITYDLIDGGDYTTLSDQHSSRDVSYSFMGILAGKIGQPDTDYLYITSDGQFSTGPLKGGNFDDNILKIGWFQDSVTLETDLGRITSDGETVHANSDSGFYGGSTHAAALLFYKDQAGNVLPWYYQDDRSFNLEGWDVDTRVGSGSAQYQLFQKTPYDAQRENYIDAWSGNNPPNPKPFPNGSTNTQTCYFVNENTIRPHIEGILPLTYNVTKTFARLGQQYFIQGGFFVPIPTAKVTITDGSPRSALLNFEKTIFDDNSRKKP